MTPFEAAPAEARSERARKRGAQAYLIVRRAPIEDVSPRSPGRHSHRRWISPTGSYPTSLYSLTLKATPSSSSATRLQASTSIGGIPTAVAMTCPNRPLASFRNCFTAS
jgi:hypothetical protein